VNYGVAKIAIVPQPTLLGTNRRIRACSLSYQVCEGGSIVQTGDPAQVIRDLVVKLNELFCVVHECITPLRGKASNVGAALGATFGKCTLDVAVGVV
jgi:hypothetical protein